MDWMDGFQCFSCITMIFTYVSVNAEWGLSRFRCNSSHASFVFLLFKKSPQNASMVCGCEYILFLKVKIALAGVAQWIERGPLNQRVAGLIPSQGTCLDCRPDP